MTHPLPPELDAGLALLDRQIVDSDGRMVAKVDDVELEQRDDGRIVVTGLLTGPGALGPRIGGAIGVLSRATWSRLAGRDADRPRRIGYEHVAEVGTVITLAVSRRTVNVDGFETWVRERLIKAIPGASKEPE